MIEATVRDDLFLVDFGADGVAGLDPLTGSVVRVPGGSMSAVCLAAGGTSETGGRPGGSSGFDLVGLLGGSGMVAGTTVLSRLGGVIESGGDKSFGGSDWLSDFSDFGLVAIAEGTGKPRRDGFLWLELDDAAFFAGAGVSAGTNSVLHFGHSTGRPRFLFGIPSLPWQFGQRAYFMFVIIARSKT